MNYDMFFIGQIVLVPYDFVPKGFIKCSGQTLLVEEYEALFSLIGFRWGGDNEKTFALPIAEAPTGMMYCICNDGVYPQRQ